MSDLSVNFAGIRSPNPFWLASAPPTNCGEQIMRAFDAGWGGAVWKTIGEPITNVSSRYSSVDWNGQRMMGLNNIELISDRPIETNLREIAEVKKRYPQHAVIASLMVESTREAWHDIVQRSEDAGADGLELNFGCPHGMSERGMGSAVGQVPEYTEMITGWVKEKARTPVLVKLTPNITDIRMIARAAKRAGADGLSAINTLNSITGIDLDTLEPQAECGRAFLARRLLRAGGEADRSKHGAPASEDETSRLPISGIGGIGTWRDAAEFILLGCGTVQVCTAAMHYGYRIVEDLIDGLQNWMREKGFSSIEDLRGLSAPKVTDWNHLNLNFKIVARIHEEKCIGCELCYIACWDGAHQCIHLNGVHSAPPEVEAASRARIAVTPIPKLDRAIAPQAVSTRIPRVDEEECVGCNLCALVCPVENCITMERVENHLPRQTWEDLVNGNPH